MGACVPADGGRSGKSKTSRTSLLDILFYDVQLVCWGKSYAAIVKNSRNTFVMLKFGSSEARKNMGKG